MHKKVLSLILFAFSLSLASGAVHARDDRQNFPVKGFFERSDVQEKLGKSVKFYFGDSRHGAVASRHGEFTSNKKTNAFNKTDKEACEWALFSAMLALRDRALKEGGNAVINIHSNYRGVTFTSPTEYQCGAGKFVAGVTMVGVVVTLK